MSRVFLMTKQTLQFFSATKCIVFNFYVEESDSICADLRSVHSHTYKVDDREKETGPYFFT